MQCDDPVHLETIDFITSISYVVKCFIDASESSIPTKLTGIEETKSKCVPGWSEKVEPLLALYLAILWIS